VVEDIEVVVVCSGTGRAARVELEGDRQQGGERDDQGDRGDEQGEAAVALRLSV
jgi:hypothetical protein